jgi:hypothetical protein
MHVHVQYFGVVGEAPVEAFEEFEDDARVIEHRAEAYAVDAETLFSGRVGGFAEVGFEQGDRFTAMPGFGELLPSCAGGHRRQPYPTTKSFTGFIVAKRKRGAAVAAPRWATSVLDGCRNGFRRSKIQFMANWICRLK